MTETQHNKAADGFHSACRSTVFSSKYTSSSSMVSSAECLRLFMWATHARQSAASYVLHTYAME